MPSRDHMLGWPALATIFDEPRAVTTHQPKPRLTDAAQELRRSQDRQLTALLDKTIEPKLTPREAFIKHLDAAWNRTMLGAAPKEPEWVYYDRGPKFNARYYRVGGDVAQFFKSRSAGWANTGIPLARRKEVIFGTATKLQALPPHIAGVE